MKKRKSDPVFDNRVRFNWGYHDAAHTVIKNLDNADANFGFGSALKISSPYDVVTKHPDHAYAIGWQAGYLDAKDGVYQAMGNNPLSDSAWRRDGKLV